MKRMIVTPGLGLTLCALLAAGCGDPGAGGEASSLEEAVTVTLPVKAKYDIEFGGIVYPPPPGRCPDDPAFANVFWIETGESTALGKLTAECNDCTYAPTAGVPTFFVDGQCTETAANGDQVFVTYSGQDTEHNTEVISWEADVVATGGTGRFEGISGSFREVATVYPPAGLTGTGVVEGTVNWPRGQDAK
jgi:hypothetical protein